MKVLVSCAESRALDGASRSALALTPLQLMEKASLRLWDSLRGYIGQNPRLSRKGKNLRLVALCGAGDNGGDGLAILRHAFSAGFANSAALFSARRLSESAKSQLESLKAGGLQTAAWDSLNAEARRELLAGADIVLDAISGTGLKGRAKGESLAMMECLAEVQSKKNDLIVAAVDLPSGLGDDWETGFPCVAADISLCLEPEKTPCYLPEARLSCGQIIPVSDIFPVNLIRKQNNAALLEASDLRAMPPPISARDYKMTRGRLAIFAGAEGSAGAALLCARAALAAGAGYVTLYVDAALYPFVAPVLESVIVKVLNAEEAAPDCDAILAGPGWGRGEGRAKLLARLWQSGIPLILDADALRILAASPHFARADRPFLAMTPHPGEFAALSAAAAGGAGAPTYIENLKAVAQTYGALVVLKSHVTWIAAPNGKKIAVWDGMTPELGAAGSGDVLAGLFAGLAARALARGPRGAAGRGSRGAAAPRKPRGPRPRHQAPRRRRLRPKKRFGALPAPR